MLFILPRVLALLSLSLPDDSSIASYNNLLYSTLARTTRAWISFSIMMAVVLKATDSTPCASYSELPSQRLSNNFTATPTSGHLSNRFGTS